MATTRTTRKPRMKVAEEVTDDAPSVMSLKSNPDREVEWRNAFEIDGTMYQIRTSAPLNVGLQYVHVYRKQGDIVASDYALEALLSPGAHQALMEFEDLTIEQLQQITKIATDIVLGKVESPN